MQKNVASQKAIFFAFDITTGAAKTGDAANITPYESLDYGAVTAITDTSMAEMDSTNAKGYYICDLTQGETNANTILFSAKSSTANISVIGAPAVVQTVPAAFVIAGGAAGGLFIAGTNAATVVTTSFTTTFTGNLTGTVASVTGAVGSVTGAVGSVTGNVGGNVTGTVGSVVGAVGSVTGNVGGNVTGSVGSVTGNVGGNVVGSVGSVAGAVASVTAPVTVGANNDKTGYVLSATGSAAMTESYAADGAAPTLAQFNYMIWSLLSERVISSTTLTAAKLDGTTPAMTFTLDSATTPTSQTRAT